MENRDRCYSKATSSTASVSYTAASCLDHVETAWRLVYERYVATGLITPNPFGVHLSSHALHHDSCVVIGKCNRSNRPLSTMTLIADSCQGLSLDSVFSRELNALRAQGRRLLEVGLLVADCSGGGRSDMTSLFEMMKWAAYYVQHMGLTDVVIGVHPHHVKFYTRCYGFEQFGEETTYPMVRNRPVVPLRLRLNERLALQVLPRGLRHVRDYPLDTAVFADRYAIREHNLEGSMIERFMHALHADDKRYTPRWAGMFDIFKGWFPKAAVVTGW